MNRRFTTRTFAVAFAVTALAASAGYAALHMRLVKSAPEKDQVVTEAPAQIQLWFSQKPEVALTRVRLTGPDGATFEVGKAKAADDKSVTMSVIDSLPEGSYSVAWRTAAPDGHKVDGEYAFTYSTDESPTGDEGDSER